MIYFSIHQRDYENCADTNTKFSAEYNLHGTVSHVACGSEWNVIEFNNILSIMLLNYDWFSFRIMGSVVLNL